MIPDIIFITRRMSDQALIYVLVLILLSPAILLTIVGFILNRLQYKKPSKICFILAGAYILIGLGICGSMMM